MSTEDCPITGDAIVSVNGDGAPHWTRTDPEVHVALEVVDDDEARAFVEARYDLGEDCPIRARTLHARLRQTPDAPGATGVDAGTGEAGGDG